MQQRKVVLTIGNAGDIHLERWVKYFHHVSDFDLMVASFEKSKYSSLTLHKNKLIAYYQLLKYCLRNEVDIIHAHYAGYYGLFGALLPGKAKVLSIWGSDIYMPFSSSKVRRLTVRFILSMYAHVISTSDDMAKVANNIYSREYIVMPFGVDTSVYKPVPSARQRKGKVILGTVKKLDRTYGIDRLIVFFSELRKIVASTAIELHIYGDGNEREFLRKMSIDLGVDDSVFFFGRSEQVDVPLVLNTFDIFLALSRSESFGVSILEASASGIPVVTSNVGGLPEVVCDQLTGYTMNIGDRPSKNQLDVLKNLIDNESLRRRMGSAGRNFVKENYEHQVCALKMLSLYQTLSKKE